MLMSDRLVALNDVLTLAAELSELYAAEQQALEQPEAQNLFKRLAGERAKLAEAATDMIRADDERPRSPDPEHETLEELISDVSAALSDDATQTLAKQRAEQEQRLLSALTAAVKVEEDTAAAERLRGYRDQVQSDIDSLNQLHG